MTAEQRARHNEYQREWQRARYHRDDGYRVRHRFENLTPDQAERKRAANRERQARHRAAMKLAAIGAATSV
jgi:hypothetical protein